LTGFEPYGLASERLREQEAKQKNPNLELLVNISDTEQYAACTKLSYCDFI